MALKPVLVNLLNRLTSFLQTDPEVSFPHHLNLIAVMLLALATGPGFFISHMLGAGELLLQALPLDISVFDLFRNFLETQVDKTILAHTSGGDTSPESSVGGMQQTCAVVLKW